MARYRWKSLTVDATQLVTDGERVQTPLGMTTARAGDWLMEFDDPTSPTGRSKGVLPDEAFRTHFTPLDD